MEAVSKMLQSFQGHVLLAHFQAMKSKATNPQILPRNTSAMSNPSLSRICCNVFNVMLCWQFSRRNSDEGVIPSFRAKAAYVISPRRLRRKLAS